MLSHISVGSGPGSCLVRQRRGPLGHPQPAVPCLPSWNLPSWGLPHLGPALLDHAPPGPAFPGSVEFSASFSPLSLTSALALCLLPMLPPHLALEPRPGLITWALFSPMREISLEQNHLPSEATHCVGPGPTATYNAATPCTRGHGYAPNLVAGGHLPFCLGKGHGGPQGHSLRGQRGCGWGESTWLSSGLIMNCVWDAVHTRFTSDIQAASRISPSSVLAKSLPRD